MAVASWAACWGESTSLVGHRRRGSELGVGVHQEALGGAAAAARRAAVLAAAARPAGEVRGRAQGVDVRELPAPVSP